jgi:hypothetical protein
LVLFGFDWEKSTLWLNPRPCGGLVGPKPELEIVPINYRHAFPGGHSEAKNIFAELSHCYNLIKLR